MARVAGDAKEEEEFDGLRCVLLDEANSGNAMRESRDEDKADTVTNTTKMEIEIEAMTLRFKKIEASESSRLKVSTGEIAILPRGFCFSLLQFKIFLPSISLLGMVLHATMMKRFKIAELVVNLKALNSQVNFFLIWCYWLPYDEVFSLEQ
ncbi:uncharacterized protein LOC111242308 isoform X2 [Vigna radiata var. radiata]|uniref:Uncharacterized protein LOC111242308 isoform X2 n=1 Tax=Vigna radiata var. radiata TaxID=3916 RepID=A0A3Q0FDD3_VIGRR|nr:uncharacterized protein LOC111242308 isoform X2 [Vigna radiata var. radiata]